MGTALLPTRGMPRLGTVAGTGITSVYNEILIVGAGGIANGAPITLPSSGSYEGSDLKVFLNGVFLAEGVDYTYLGAAGPGKTQIQNDRLDIDEGDQYHFIVEGSVSSIYDETVVIGGGGLTAGALVTLPNTGTYSDINLKVYLEGILLAVVEDYNYVGVIPRTQIQTVVDLLEGERLRFRIEG